MHRSNDTGVCAYFIAFRSNNFIVGLTNISPQISSPTLWNYTLCGQYPGAVPSGATVSLHCSHNLPQFRYVIVHFPVTRNHMNFCELQVIAPGTVRDCQTYQVFTVLICMLTFVVCLSVLVTLGAPLRRY